MEVVLTLGLAVIGILVYIINDLKGELKYLSDTLLEQEDQHKEDIKKARQDSKFRSSAVNWGCTIENFVPFIDSFPIPPEDVNFLGKPIDYVGFTHTDSKTKCEVHFIEVKSGQSPLSQKQRNIKSAIQQGRVRWHEVRVDANNLKKGLEIEK